MKKYKGTKVKTMTNKAKSKESEKKEKIKVKNNYFLGIIGAILGGAVASIPWILVYVYGNLMLSALSVLIPIGIFYGYKLFGGRTTKVLPTIVVIISILITIITMLVLIPIFLIQSQGTTINFSNFSNLKYLYENMNLFEGMILDIVIAIIFTIFGAYIISAIIKKKIANENIEINNSKDLDSKKIKNKIISKLLTIIIGLIFISAMVGLTIYNQIKISSPQEVTDGMVSFQIDAGWIQGNSEYDQEWVYYRYINNIPPTEKVEEGDYSKYPACVDIMYFQNDTEETQKIEEIKESTKESMMSQENKPETYEDYIEKTSNGYDILKLRLTYKLDYESIEYIYYILKDDMLAVIDIYSYNTEDELELKETIESTTKSFKWLE